MSARTVTIITSLILAAAAAAAEVLSNGFPTF